MIAQYLHCVARSSDMTAFLPISIKYRNVTYDAMEMAIRVFKFSNAELGERVIGCSANERSIESYNFGYYLGTNSDNKYVFAFIYEDQPYLVETEKEELRDRFAIYQALHKDIEKGTLRLNRMRTETFGERWDVLHPDRFEKNRKRRYNIARFENWITRECTSPGY